MIILLPYLYYKNRTTGEVVPRIKDLSFVKEYLVIALLFSLILINLIFKGKLKVKTDKLYKEEETINSYLIESLSSVEAIKGMHIEQEVIKRFVTKYKNFLSSYYSQSFLMEIISILKNILYNLFITIILYFGCKYVINTKLSLSYLIVFQSILNFYTNSFNSLIILITEYPKYKISIERVEDLFTIKKETFECSNYYKLYHLNGIINYNNLTYSYNNKILLKNVNLKINPGDKIFLQGPSGVGKSTLVKLLMRYIEIPFNSITINDIDINHYHLDILRENITYISQQELLFNGTISSNIKLYRDYPKEKIEEVMKISLVNEIGSINKLVEENGFNFSGGERQRIILARSILKKSDIYIFDEAFSQIDIVREKKIILNIFKYLKNKTIIVISHRFDNKELFDRIISLKNGSIFEEKL